MCGDLEEGNPLDDEIFAWLLNHARRLGAAPGAGGETGFPGAAGRNAYMDGLFRAALAGALTDAGAAPEGERSDAIAAQALVFARLAGFLAGHLPPEADMFRATIEALMHGHGEPDRLAETRGHHHDRHHGHDHGR
jgi:hypothetical protein